MLIAFNMRVEEKDLMQFREIQKEYKNEGKQVQILFNEMLTEFMKKRERQKERTK